MDLSICGMAGEVELGGSMLQEEHPTGRMGGLLKAPVMMAWQTLGVEQVLKLLVLISVGYVEMRSQMETYLLTY
jgi:hypothetical protein